jgi:hypothetical protein
MRISGQTLGGLLHLHPQSSAFLESKRRKKKEAELNVVEVDVSFSHSFLPCVCMCALVYRYRLTTARGRLPRITGGGGMKRRHAGSKQAHVLWHVVTLTGPCMVEAKVLRRQKRGGIESIPGGVEPPSAT